MLSNPSFRNLYVVVAIVALGILVGSCKKDENPVGGGGGGGTINVNGFVKDVNGVPVAGQTVIVKGKTAVVTGSNGAFSVSGVTTPYQISLIVNTLGLKIATVYDGITRSDPTLYYLFGSLGTSKSATITGNAPAAAGKVTKVFFVSGLKSWSTTANPGTGAYTINATWTDSATSYTGTLYLLRWTPGTNGLPTGYDGFGEKSQVISNGGSFTVNFAPTDLTDPADQTIAGSITRPTTSYNLTEKTLYLSFGNATVFVASESGSGLTDNFNYNVPTIAGATFAVTAYAQLAATPGYRTAQFTKTGIAGGASGVNVPLAAAPQLNLPAHNGTNVDTTTQFLWAPGGGTGINLVLMFSTSTNPVFYILTAANSITIPNFNPQGMGLPSNTAYSWSVEQVYPVSSMDNVVSGSFSPFIGGSAGDIGVGRSETFSFTTVP